jgi:aminodeoxyfutalosine synthase
MNAQPRLKELLTFQNIDSGLQKIAEKVFDKQRLSPSDGIYLYENGDLGFLGSLANYIREEKHGDTTYFNRNFHIEPTNLCVFTCKFCAYSRLIKQRDEGWMMTEDQILDIVRSYQNQPVTEVHIVGGVLPQMNLKWFGDILEKIKQIMPDIHIKGFTAVELDYMFRKGKVSIKEGLTFLMEKGLDSLPGGGAEIFDEKVRDEICGDKCDSATWLKIHETAHDLNMHSNATILYGHIESYADRIDHMERLRNLQDKTGGFNTFIPLKFRNGHNQMSHVKEVSMIEDLKNYAVSRIYLDNFPHIKAYWPMIGRDTAQLSLNYGVNDIDGTIDDSTKIYSMAGAEDQNPAMTTREIVEMIDASRRHAIERDTVYNVVKDYKDYDFEMESAKTNHASVLS